jgi:hypothetical protein
MIIIDDLRVAIFVGVLAWRTDRWQQAHLHGNLRGWNQNRKIIERNTFAVAA